MGGDLQVNTATTGDQYGAAVVAKAFGQFVVVWLDSTPPAPRRVMGQRFDAVGGRVGAEFQVSMLTAASDRPSVAGSPEVFVVSWTRQVPPASAVPAVRRYDKFGNQLGPEYDVDTSVGGQPSVDINGDWVTFTVVWRGDDGQNGGIFGRRFDHLGGPLGGRFAINTYTSAHQEQASVAADSGGNFLVAWTDWAQDGSGKGVFGRRFGGLRPEILDVDTTPLPTANANGVLEAGETAHVAPAWRNVSGAQMGMLQGVASAFTGPGAPGNPTYSIPDAAANYGVIVPNGEVVSCMFTTDCYRVATSVPTARPVVHWDATIREDILYRAQSKVWTLHFGESFADVAPTSPFYRFVETLLHRNVTGGCSPTEYCPTSSTTREQMAVFVLVAKEGAGYLPPACTTPMFADVPASSPFCRWIEELARRAVVTGCGGGNYCPSNAVSREQMAVFVLRTLDAALNPPACTTPIYNDVPASSPFCRWIEELTRRNVVTGCGGGNYCPTAGVTREQMGVFISATFGLVLYGP